MSYTEILNKAIDTYGPQLQLTVAMEEMAELQKEISKAIRGDADKIHLAEEMADVYIMLEQMKIIFAIPPVEVEMWMDVKLQRLKQRLEN